LLVALDRAFDQRSWHGTNLRGALRNVSFDEAEWRPAPARHCIAEHVFHAAYWKYTVRRRLTREKRGSFVMPGSDWFALPNPWNAQSWKLCVRVLADEHKALRSVIAALTDRDLDKKERGRKVSLDELITGIAAHDLYHAGQIQLLKRLQRT